jgi:hypothetical protein
VIFGCIFNIQIYHTNYYNIYDFFSLIITLIILEFISYIIHILQHIPFIYKLSYIIIKKKYVNIWMTYFSNPLDYLMTSIPLSIIMPSIIKLHYTVIFKKIILFSKKKYVFNIIIKTFNIL